MFLFLIRFNPAIVGMSQFLWSESSVYIVVVCYLSTDWFVLRKLTRGLRGSLDERAMLDLIVWALTGVCWTRDATGVLTEGFTEWTIDMWVLTGGIRGTRIGGNASDEMTWTLDSRPDNYRGCYLEVRLD